MSVPLSPSLKLNTGDSAPAEEVTRDISAMKKDAQQHVEKKKSRMSRIDVSMKGSSNLPPGLAEILSTWDNDGDGTVDLVELAAAAELYKQHKEQAKFYKKAAIGLVGLIAVLLIMMFTTSYLSNEMSKEVFAKNGVMTGGGTAIVQTAVAQAGLGLRFASVMDMGHLKNIDEVSYTLDTGRGIEYGKQVSEKVMRVSKELTERDGADWPVVEFATAAGNRVVVDPLDLHLITPDGTSTKLCAKLAADEQSGLRCNALEIDDPALDAAALEDKLAEYVAETDAGRLLTGTERLLWDCG